MKSSDSKAANLFSRLFSYTPRVDRTSLEDYCSEALAWCLRLSPGVAQAFLDLTGIERLRGYRDSVDVDTQLRFKGSADEDAEDDTTSMGGRFDLVIYPRERPDFVLVVESKIGAPLGPNQLKTYREQLDNGPLFRLVPRSARFLGALTDRAESQPLDQAKGVLKWSEVYKLLEKPPRTKTAHFDAKEAAAVEHACQQFAAFLKDNGMSIDLPKANSDIRSYAKGLLFRQEIERLLGRVRRQNSGLKEHLKRTVRFDHDESSDSIWLGLYNKPGYPYLYVGFQLIEANKPRYSMLVETEWRNDSSERRAFKKRLGREFPGRVEEECGFIQLRQPINSTYDGEVEKMIEWLGRAAVRTSTLLLKGRKPKKKSR
jgi:PD-(D/E)XK nuclease superfamily